MTRYFNIKARVKKTRFNKICPYLDLVLEVRFDNNKTIVIP